MKKIYEGLGILLKYAPNGSCDAQHDELFAEGPRGVSEEDAVKLAELGWRWDQQIDSWAKFT